MKTSHFFYITCIVCSIAIAATWYFTKKHADAEPTPPVAQSAPQQQTQPAPQPAGAGVASGKDTIVMVFNKQSAEQILGALQNQYPTPANAPDLPVQRFLATQGVFNYLQGMITKKWPDLAPKPVAPAPPVKK